MKAGAVLAPACWVSRYTTSKVLKVVNTVLMTAGVIMGLMAGTMMYRVRWNQLAPSSRALSS